MNTFWIVWDALRQAVASGKVREVSAGNGHITVVENDGTERQIVIS